MSASQKTEIRYYLLDDCKLGQQNAVSDIMRLFGAKEIGREDMSVPASLEHTVFIKQVLWGNTLSLTCRCQEVSSASKHSLDQSLDEQREKKEIARLIKMHVLKFMRTLTGYDPGPWGILKGVKPTKLVNRFLDEGIQGQDLLQHLVQNYGVAAEKAALLLDITKYQRLLLPDMVKPSSRVISIYVGIPFCPSKCLYCSFPSYPLLPGDEIVAAFLSALARDIEDIANFVDRYGLLVQNVYVGGGTPTSLKGKDFEWLLRTIKNAFVSDFTQEYTVEAGRPDSIDEDQIALMKQYNVTRVSVNPQTMQEKTLQCIGRKHTVQDIVDAFQVMRKANIPSINMDVIAGLPGEKARDMENTMQQLMELKPDNITVHTLAIKKGSRLKEHLAEYPLPTAEETREMLQIADIYAQKLSMKPYYLYRQKYMTGNMENIGYSKPGFECLYNIQVLEERQTIIGMGPAAATKAVNAAKCRLDNFYHPKDLTTYIRNLDRYLAGRRRTLSELFCYAKEE